MSLAICRYNKFEITLKIVLSSLILEILFCKNLSSLTLAQECSSSNNLPQIEVENSPIEFIDRLPCRNLSVVELNTEPGVSRTYFHCRHNNPIEWVIDIHPTRDRFRFTRNFYQRIQPKNTSQTANDYSIFVVLLYQPSELTTPTLFICKDACEGGSRTFLEITPGRFAISSKVTSVPSTEKFKALANKLMTNRVSEEKQEPCAITLVVKDNQDKVQDRHSLEYKWIPRNDTKILKHFHVSSSTTTDQGMYFRNVFRTVFHKRDCVWKLRNDEVCHNCTEILVDQHDEDVINSVAFYARTDFLGSMAFRGVFSITTPRKFYFDWELPLEEMVDFSPPNLVYVGQEILLKCNVSTIYFAYGTIISETSKVAHLEVTTSNNCSLKLNSGEFETWTSKGIREVTKSIKFSEGNMTLDLTCSAPLWNWSKRVNKTVSIFVDYPVPPRILNGSLSEELILEGGETNVTLLCSGYGKPRPLLSWEVPEKRQNETDFFEVTNHVINTTVNPSTNGEDMHNNTSQFWISSTLTIPEIKENFMLKTYKCILSNEFGKISKTFTLKIPTKGLSTGVKAGISSGLGGLILICFIIALLIYRKILINRKAYRTKMAEVIREFKEGIKTKQGQKDKEVFFSHPDVIGHKQQYEHYVSILELPYNDKFEVEKDKWVIGDIFLGEGAFGFVRKGEVEILPQQKHVVAVKMLKGTVDIEDFKGFLTELKIMAYIGCHPNVVSLVAACTQDIDDNDVMIGVEFCSNGSLHQYLQDKRIMYQATDTRLNNTSSRATYANLSNSVALTEMDLYTWSYQIANGMQFLAHKKVLHGDIACRNILLTSDKTAKISDFGLSRVLLDSKNYTKKSRAPLPWKWLALEALTALQFSSASDVWAFGVTLWEIFSLGETPYAGLSFGPEFIAQIENGMRLKKPELATDYVYNIMKHCWNTDIDSRVNFTQLKSAFSELLNIYMNPEPGSGPEAGPGEQLPPSRRIAANTQLSLRHSPVAQPRRANDNPTTVSPWYSNRPTQVPNLYLNV